MRSLLLASLLTVFTACGGTENAQTEDPKPKAEVTSGDYALSLPTAKYTVSPSAGDASVSAELGGPGFTGEGWETRMEFPGFANADAPQGGEMVQYIPDWPATLRMAGKNWNTQYNYRAMELMYETLLDLNPIDLEFNPRLATHWKISDDKSTYSFRINPEAKWSDGKPVTAQDVVATWQLRTDPLILEPSSVATYGKLEKPVAVSPYIVEVKVKEESWRNFLYFAASMRILPAHDIGDIDGTEYLDQFQFKYTAHSGPYTVEEDGIDTGKSITVTRRDDWWAENNPAFDGMFNIKDYTFIVVKEPGLAFEKLKKGEIDYMAVPKAQWWAEEMPALDQVKNGTLVMRKFYTDAPIGTSGIAINMDREPLNDVRVRKALQLLNDRKTKIEKLYFNEYEPLNSYWQGPTYSNPDNVLFEYDELGAVELLEAAGWTEINDEGYRVKDGKKLGLALQYASALSEPGLTIFQENCKKAGIQIELQLLTPAARWKNLQDKEYDLSSSAWGAIIFPNPESSWKSTLADQKANNNVVAFRNDRVDELCEIYDSEYNVQKRIELIREMDGIIYNEHPYILDHYLPAERLAFWNKFGMPEWGGARTHDGDNMHIVWWVDPAMDKALAEAKSDPTKQLAKGESHVRYWAAWNKAN